MAREIDDINKRKKLKDLVFGKNKTTTDTYTGKRISKSKTDVDHIIPCDEINRRYSNLSVSQRKKLANSNSNLALTHKSINRSKGALSNWEYVDKRERSGKPLNFETAANMIESQYQSEKKLRKNAIKMTIGNVFGRKNKK